jgi:hypothetical protein
MACAICKTRREKRHCPGVQGDICAICCGEQREETVACPLDCEYLQIAHMQEVPRKNPDNMPNPDFRVSDDFLRKNVELILSLQHALLVAALTSDAIDSDVKEALEALIRTYKTLESGIYYESRPANPMAASIFLGLQERVAEIREAESERGVHKVLDSHVLTILVFLQQMEFAFNNGRRKGRCFLNNLRATMAEAAEQQPAEPASLIVS